MVHNRKNYELAEDSVSVSNFEYSGTELELFASARNWKDYLSTLVSQYLKGEILEVGAGIGRNTCLLNRPHFGKWLCLEPDVKLFRTLTQLVISCGVNNCYFQNGTIDSLDDEQLFDSILYLDVLEHIREDKEEIFKASSHLRVGGHLVILAPAHQCLYTSFDAAIGHHRRYNKSSLKATLPSSIRVIELVYLDCVGLLAILGNKFILKQNKAGIKQIQFWDRLMIPISWKLDNVLGRRLGKTILLIGRKI